MATLFSDDFAAALSATNWSQASGTWSTSGGNLQITVGGGAYRSCVTTTSAHAAIADCSATITRITGSGFDGGPAVRVSGNTQSYYFDCFGTNSNEIFRRVSSADTLLQATTQAGAANDVLKIQASGTGATVSVSIYRNGVQIGSTYSDTAAGRITSAGQTGVIAWNSTQAYDNFLAEDLAGGATTRGNPFDAGNAFDGGRTFAGIMR